MTRRRTALSATAIAATCLLAACAADGASAGGSTADEATGTTVRVADVSSANHLTLGRSSGIVDEALDEALDEAGFEARWLGPYTVPTVAYDALLTGQADVTTTDASQLLTWAAEERDVVAFALETTPGDDQGVVVGAGVPVTGVEDLRGLTVAVGPTPGGAGDYVLAKALAAVGLTSDDVQRVYLSEADATAEFVAGTVDAWATTDQHFATAQSIPGAVVVARGDHVGSHDATVHVVSRTFAHEHPDVVRALYDGLVTQAVEARQRPSAVTDLYARAGAPGDAVAIIGTFDVPQIEPLDDAGVERLRSFADDLVELGFLAVEPHMAHVAVDATATSRT
ncbi:ABC transporter substrate-binding protein [Cellulomonas fimi]|uniref:ABC transporter substrate-binding protein n=1 Tax=Cellulomonas fimi TaxID=1708 RepID=UPI00234D5B7D|nr:ABC transporter substrate-binding protein [Cellulomonas fimi]MDC7121521.1 ABC transporter substrate-binding protein [Cellulomonas fimi]